MALYMSNGREANWTRATGSMWQPNTTYTVVVSPPPLRGRKLLAFMRKNAWRINRRKRP
jgi:hypothetical protein